MSETTLADRRARAAALWERANRATPEGEWPTVTRLTSGPALAEVPEGFTAWAVGPWDDEGDDATARHIVVQPSLDPAAPIDVQRRLLARIITLGVGRCPLCSRVAGLTRQPPAPGEQGIAAWRVLPLYVQVRHTTGCPAEFADSERHLFPILRMTDEETTP